MEDLTPYYTPEVCDGICCGDCEQCLHVDDAMLERENWEDFEEEVQHENHPSIQ